MLDQVYATGIPFTVRRRPLVLASDPGGTLHRRFLDFIYQPIRDAAGAVTGIFVDGSDVTEATLAADAPQASEERQSLLLRLVRRQRRTDDPAAMMRAASQAIGRRLGASQAGFLTLPDHSTMTFTAGWTDGSLDLPTGTFPAEGIGTAYLAALRRGAALGVADVAQDPLTAGSMFAGIGARAVIGAPIIRAGRWHAAMYVNQGTVRDWTDAEVALVREVADLTWDAVERAEARAALQRSEARWRAIFQNMREGFALCQMVHGAAGQAVDFRYLELNAAWQRLTGVPAAAALGCLATAVFPALEDFWIKTYDRVVRTGEPAHFEHRVGAVDRWFEVFAYRTEPGCFAALFLNVTERKAAEERQTLLVREVDHRANNALTVVQAALHLTDAPDVAELQEIHPGAGQRAGAGSGRADAGPLGRRRPACLAGRRADAVSRRRAGIGTEGHAGGTAGAAARRCRAAAGHGGARTRDQRGEARGAVDRRWPPDGVLAPRSGRGRHPVAVADMDRDRRTADRGRPGAARVRVEGDRRNRVQPAQQPDVDDMEQVGPDLRDRDAARRVTGRAGSGMQGVNRSCMHRRRTAPPGRRGS